MQQVISHVLQFRGTHYDFGVYQGEQLKKTSFIQNHVTMNERLAKKFTVDIAQVSQLFSLYAPGLHDEIRGLAKSLNLSLEQAYLQFSGYYANPKSGCSIYIGDDFLVRNYDQEPSTYDGRYVLFQPTDTGIASIGPTMQITGRTDGMNEYGLVIGYNFVNTRKHEDGFVCNMIARIVLETCRTTEQAVSLLQQLPHKHSFNYCLIDTNDTSAIVEATPRKVVIRHGFACTNHFQLQTEENRYTMADSIAREQKLNTLAQQKPTLQYAYQLLNDIDAGVFANKYSAWDGTLHTATYIPSSLTATLSLGGNAMPMPISFRKWLHGDSLHVTKIKGQLNI